jgi:hypothetical protein
MERVNKTEKDMNDMLKYLNAVEEMMGGDDLAQIRRMLSFTSQSVSHHTDAYTAIKSRVEDMNKEASGALNKLSSHNDDLKRIMKESET